MDEINKIVWREASSSKLVQIKKEKSGNHVDTSIKREASSSKSIQIFIRTPTGKTITLDVETCTTVNVLKHAIQRKVGSPVDAQRVMFGGRQLEDDRPLSYYDILDDATLLSFLFLD